MYLVLKVRLKFCGSTKIFTKKITKFWSATGKNVEKKVFKWENFMNLKLYANFNEINAWFWRWRNFFEIANIRHVMERSNII